MAHIPEPEFLHLPAELRNQIYEHLAYTTKAVTIRTHECVKATPAPLSQVCRQLREEFGPLLNAIPLKYATSITVDNTNFCTLDLIRSLSLIPAAAPWVERKLVFRFRLTSSLTILDVQRFTEHFAEPGAPAGLVAMMRYDVEFAPMMVDLDLTRMMFARLAKRYRFHHSDGEQRVWEKIYWSFAEAAEKVDGVQSDADFSIKREVIKQHAHAYQGKRGIDACASNSQAQALTARNVARRSQVAKELRQKRGITSNPQKFRRDLATLEIFEAVDHNRTGIDQYDPTTQESIIFGANTSAIVTPEVTDGPYYVTGESIRKNVKEALYSDGIDLYFETQYIDIETCQPVPGMYVDIWNANATGVYSGIEITGNDAADGWNSTYLRGIQVTDHDGVAAFETIFPGHYSGRATHTHLMAHMNVTVFPNNTIAATNNITHIGQVFYNEVLRSAVEATYPYSSNTQPVTSNEADQWSIVQADTYYDPFPEFLYLGDSIEDGLLAWIQVGVNTSANYVDNAYYKIAAEILADGGHVNTDPATEFTGGGGSSTGGNGTSTNGTATSSGSAAATA
ncbi:hypothetical protein LTR65_001871 [Meristemomyces frigidus]